MRVKEGPTIYQRRIVVGAAICSAAFLIVFLQLVRVTLLRPPPAGGIERIAAARADLVDRNGELLARDLPVTDVYALVDALDDKDAAAHALADATGAGYKRLAYSFTHAKHPYALVARQLTPDAVDRVMKLGIPGLEFEPNSKRYYPQGRVTAQLVGVTDPDGNGQSGLERGLDDRLHKSAGARQVVSSIDMRVQYILDSEVAAARRTFRTIKAGGIVMDVNTGEIIAMASFPDFDPNWRHFEGDDSDKNIMAGDRYELGSVFKVLSFALAMEDHTTTPDEVFRIGNGFPIGKYVIHEAEAMPATYTARDILAHSSNIGTAQIALRSGAARQREFLRSLGLLDMMDSALPERARPLYPRNNWGTIETATIGFGHGISVAPLSYVTAAAIVVNGGRKIVPTFVKHPEDGRGAQILKPETSVKMRELLRYVVTNGTGRKADIPGYEVGGKTGSAEKPRENGIGYQHHVLVTSFLAVFPVFQPRYIVFVLLDEPHGAKESGGGILAGLTAAPLAGRVITRIAPVLGVAQKPIAVAQRETP
jgi:cell division protein FtsI (penicillin-binding protein 3)